jgi:hypothetical protein
MGNYLFSSVKGITLYKTLAAFMPLIVVKLKKQKQTYSGGKSTVCLA